MIGSFLKALAQIADRRFFKVWLLGMLLSLLLFAAIVGVVALVLFKTSLVKIGWLDAVIDWAAPVAAFVGGILFFPGLALFVISQLLEPICSAVEAKHYPQLPKPRRVPVRETVGAATKLGVLTVILNVIFLPLSLFLNVLSIPLYYLVNGILVGREYWDIVSARRLDRRDAVRLRKRSRIRVFLDGALITFLLSIPFVGWTMAVIGCATMVHEFEKIHARKG